MIENTRTTKNKTMTKTIEEGTKQFNRGNYQEALKIFSKIISSDPNNVKGHEYVARCYYHMGYYEKSIEFAQKLKKICPDCEAAYNIIAMAVRSTENDPELLVSIFKEGVNANPNNGRLAHSLAKAYHELGDYDDALIYYNSALTSDPMNVPYLIDRAIAYMNNGMEEDAYIDLRKVMNIEPDNPFAKDLLNERIGTRLSEDDVNRGLTRFSFAKVKSITHADVAGLTDLKQELMERIVLPFQFREISRKYAITSGGGLLLYGPPGCGKTHVIKATAGETRMNLVDVRVPEVLDKWAGNAERNLHNLFEMARRNAPTIVFIDEIDALGGKREESVYSGSRLSVNTLLMELDSLSSENQDVLVVGATNAPWLIDPALIRSGRFGRFFYVPPPDRKMRVALFKQYLKNRPVSDNVDYEKLADLTARYYSSADIVAICYEAAKIPWREALSGGYERDIVMNDMEASIKRIRPTLIQWYENADKSFSSIREEFIDMASYISEYREWKSGRNN